MASHFISFDKGDGINPGNLTVGTSSASTEAVELRTLDGAGLSRLDVKLALEAFEAYYNTHSVTA